MKQHTVPQNIMSVEFKIIGDLTIRQFIYVTIAGGISFIFWLTIPVALLKYTLIIISILIGIMITFAKVNERPFDEWINNLITAIMLPTQRVWRKSSHIPYYLLLAEKRPEAEKVEREQGYSKFVTYLNSRSLPTDDVYRPNTKLDIEEIKMLTNINKLFKTTSNVPHAPHLSQVKPPGQAAPQQKTAPQMIQKTQQPVQQAQKVTERKDISSQPRVMEPMHTSSPIVHPPTPLSSNTSGDTQSNKGMIFKMPAMLITHQQEVEQQKHIEPEKPLVHVAQVQPLEERKTAIPHMHAVPKLAEEASIPHLVSEKTEEPKDNVFKLEPDTIIKIDDLKHVKSADEIAHMSPVAQQNTNTDTIPIGETDRHVKGIDIDLGINFDSSALPPIDPTRAHKRLQVQQPQTEMKSGEKLILHKPLEASDKKKEQKNQPVKQANIHGGAVERLIKKTHEPLVHEQPLPNIPPASRTKSPDKLVGHMPDFVQYPNIVSGVVVDSQEKIVDDVVVIIKSQTKQIMRAMRTNMLGQFFSRNPLTNGLYTIEATKVGYIFAPVSVQLSGKPVEPLVIRPKVFDNKVDNGVTFNLLGKTHES